MTGGMLNTPAISKLGNACTGCGACSVVCPTGCIVMEEDKFGFLRPSVNADVCVGCGRCEDVCPALKTRKEDEIVSVRWARTRDEGLLMGSSSGGIFGLLARGVLAHGGVVCGAAWDVGCTRLGHVIVETEQELQKILRSKYVQSAIEKEIYWGIREALRQGKAALFAGTACQVSAMRAYLGKLYDSPSFLAVEVICHGVPSPLLWRRWLEYKAPSQGATAREVNFRSKTTGWSSYNVQYRYSESAGDEESVTSAEFRKDWYMKAFLRNASLRPSCYECPVKRASGSDITLGDFWGVDKWHPGVGSDDRGVSAIIANTQRGERAIQSILEFCEWGPSTLDAVADGNPSLLRPVTPYGDHRAFMSAIADGVPMETMMRKWSFEDSFASRLKKAILRRVSRRS